MERTQLSLKWLEVFQAVARGGSVQEAARRLGISTSTVSHHLTCLEAAVGVALVDHGKRPMALTQEGAILIRRADEALGQLRKGVSEIWSRDPGALVRVLRIAAIEELDREVTPTVAAQLVRDLRSCDLSFLTRPSHDILALLEGEYIDIGIAAALDGRGGRVIETPLLRDPYIILAPRAGTAQPDAYLTGEAGLPFLRYSKTMLIGRRIELQFRRMRRVVPSRMEFESTPAMLPLIAAGQAWTVTTALTLAACSEADHVQIAALPVPRGGFARQLSLFRQETLPEALAEMVEAPVRRLIETQLIAPVLARAPWLTPDFRLLEAGDG